MIGVPPEIFLLEVGCSRFFVVAVSVWFHMVFYTLILLAGFSEERPAQRTGSNTTKVPPISQTNDNMSVISMRPARRVRVK
ncbi:hypothetical protein ACC674_38740, partial [Rhizobium ruizarguesonis]